MSSPFRGTTICAVRKNGETAIAGDGQVTMGEHTIFKTTAKRSEGCITEKLPSGLPEALRMPLRFARNSKRSFSRRAVTLKGQRWRLRRHGEVIRLCVSWSP